MSETVLREMDGWIEIDNRERKSEREQESRPPRTREFSNGSTDVRGRLQSLSRRGDHERQDANNSLEEITRLGSILFKKGETARDGERKRE